jgi:hypothetical protein
MGLSAMPVPLLFQQIVPVDDAQATLTRMCLTGISESLMAYFLALRAETDAALAPLLAPAGGKPYPYGRCEEITRELHARLVKRLALQLQLPFQVGLFSFGLVAAAPDGPSDDESGFDPALG